MLTLSRTQWNMALAITLVVGVLFVAATRVRPETSVSLPSERGTVATTPAPRENHPAPDFTLVDLAGAPVQLSELRGSLAAKPVYQYLITPPTSRVRLATTRPLPRGSRATCWARRYSSEDRT